MMLPVNCVLKVADRSLGRCPRQAQGSAAAREARGFGAPPARLRGGRALPVRPPARPVPRSRGRSGRGSRLFCANLWARAGPTACGRSAAASVRAAWSPLGRARGEAPGLPSGGVYSVWREVWVYF